MVVSGADSVRHCCQLISVGIEEFLQRLLCAHLGPLAIRLEYEVVEVAEVANLHSGQPGIFGQAELKCLGNGRRHDGTQ